MSWWSCPWCWKRGGSQSTDQITMPWWICHIQFSTSFASIPPKQIYMSYGTGFWCIWSSTSVCFGKWGTRGKGGSAVCKCVRALEGWRWRRLGAVGVFKSFFLLLTGVRERHEPLKYSREQRNARIVLEIHKFSFAFRIYCHRETWTTCSCQSHGLLLSAWRCSPFSARQCAPVTVSTCSAVQRCIKSWLVFCLDAFY